MKCPLCAGRGTRDFEHPGVRINGAVCDACGGTGQVCEPPMVVRLESSPETERTLDVLPCLIDSYSRVLKAIDAVRELCNAAYHNPATRQLARQVLAILDKGAPE